MFFFKRKSKKKAEQVNQAVPEQKAGIPLEEWRDLPAYVEAPDEDRQKVLLIASAIAAGSAPDSRFTVKKVLVKNPEVTRVSVIAAALAEGDKPLRITRVAEKIVKPE